MNKPKFKAWNKVGKFMLEWEDFIGYEIDQMAIVGNEYRIFNDDEFEILLYSDMPDIKNQLVAKGDIVKATYIGKDNIERTTKFTIKFENHSFMLYNKFGYYGHLSCVYKAKLQWLKNTLEVIGNIHQTPELLEGL